MNKCAITLSLFLGLTACATTGSQSPDQAITRAAVLFNARESLLIWVPGTTSSLGTALASSLIGTVGLGSPIVRTIHQAMAPAAHTDVRVAIAGPESTFTARAIVAALTNTTNMLPKLELAFIGTKADADEVRHAVEAKGGRFLFAPATAP